VITLLRQSCVVAKFVEKLGVGGRAWRLLPALGLVGFAAIGFAPGARHDAEEVRRAGNLRNADQAVPPIESPGSAGVERGQPGPPVPAPR